MNSDQAENTPRAEDFNYSDFKMNWDALETFEDFKRASIVKEKFDDFSYKVHSAIIDEKFREGKFKNPRGFRMVKYLTNEEKIKRFRLFLADNPDFTKYFIVHY